MSIAIKVTEIVPKEEEGKKVVVHDCKSQRKGLIFILICTKQKNSGIHIFRLRLR
jgi:hypothetical protein